MKRFVLILILACVGCGSNDGRFIGTWKPEAELTDEDKESGFAEMGQALVGSIRLNLTADKATFSAPFGQQKESTWSYDGTHIEFHDLPDWGRRKVEWVDANTWRMTHPEKGTFIWHRQEE